MTASHHFPAPGDDHSQWQQDAACRGVDVETFYHPDNERGAKRQRHEMRAKAICATCPVVQPCLDWAVSRREPYGVWGGQSPDERAQRRLHLVESDEITA